MLAEHNGSEFNRDGLQTERYFGKYRTMLPVLVKKVYAADGKTTATRGAVAPSGFVDVQPVVSQVDGAGQRQDHGTIYHVPYTRIMGGNAAILMDPVAGDIGWIMCADRDISAFKDQIAQGGSTQPVLPGSQRRYDLADAIYVGGTKSGAPAQYDSWNSSGITRTDVNGNALTMNQSGHVLSSPNQATMFSGGNATVTGLGTTTVSGGTAVNISSSGSITIGVGSAGIGITGGSTFISGLSSSTYTRLTSGTAATYNPPAGCVRLRVRMVGGGGGGGAVNTNAGADGGTTSFGSWTAVGGSGGGTGGPSSFASGGSGGASGTGTQIDRVSGGAGGNSTGATPPIGGMGGNSSRGGGAPNNNNTVAGTSAAPNSGSGGAGAATGSGGGGGGGAGESVEFSWPSPPASITYTVGAGGNGGAAGGLAGGNGAAGIILIEELYY